MARRACVPKGLNVEDAIVIFRSRPRIIEIRDGGSIELEIVRSRDYIDHGTFRRSLITYPPHSITMG